jgi:N-acetylglutamate synthase-like GNAT family acetyltransferase
VGGENLLEKAEEQERLLEASARELQETIKKEQILRSLQQCCGSGSVRIRNFLQDPDTDP